MISITWKKERNRKKENADRISERIRKYVIKGHISARWSRFDFRFSLCVFRFSFFAFRFSFFAFRFSIFELSRKIVFWHSKSYFDIRTESENAILIFKIRFWHSNWLGKCYFDIRNPILTFELSWKMLFWYSKSCFDIRTESANPILTFPTQFECQNRILISKYDFPTQLEWVRISKNEYRKPKSEKRKTKSEKRITKSEKRKAKIENQTNFTLPIFLNKTLLHHMYIAN